MSSEEEHIKCACTNCAGRIEFPRSGIGHTVNCPHCGLKTVLSEPKSIAIAKPPAPPKPEKVVGDRTCSTCGAPMAADAKICIQCGAGLAQTRRKKMPLYLGAAAALVVLASGGWLAWQKRDALPNLFRKSDAAPGEAGGLTPSPNTPPMAVVPDRPKSPDDLKVSQISIERTTGSSLVYVIGTVKNDSDHQRFGVKVNLDLFDRANAKIGDSTDYMQILEPRQEWRFRALVLDPKAVTAKLASLVEDD